MLTDYTLKKLTTLIRNKIIGYNEDESEKDVYDDTLLVKNIAVSMTRS